MTMDDDARLYDRAEEIAKTFETDTEVGWQALVIRKLTSRCKVRGELLAAAREEPVARPIPQFEDDERRWPEDYAPFKDGPTLAEASQGGRYAESRPLTPIEVEAIHALRAQGWTHDRIAELFKCSTRTVNRHLK